MAIFFFEHLGLWQGGGGEGVPYRGNKKGVFFIQRSDSKVIGLDLRTAKEVEAVPFVRAPSFVIDGKSAKDVLPKVVAKRKCPSCKATKLAWAEEPGGAVACQGCGGMFELPVLTGEVGYPISLSWAARLEGKWAAGEEKAVIAERPSLVSAEGAQALKAALAVAREVPLRAFAPGKEIDDQGIAAMGEHPQLRFLRLWYSPKMTAEGFAPIAKYTTLEHLDIGNNRVLDDGAANLVSKMKNLESLVLDQTNFGDEGLAAIAKLKSLEYLSLNSTKVTEDGVAALAKHPRLRTVRLGWTKIGPDALKHLATIKSLETVETFDCSELPQSKRGSLKKADL